MDAGVVDRLDPGAQQPVQFEQVGDMVAARLFGLAGDLEEELVTDRAEEPLDFAPALGAAGGGVGEFDPECRTRAQQPGVHER
jgi:hypothetical protein